MKKESIIGFIGLIIIVGLTVFNIDNICYERELTKEKEVEAMLLSLNRDKFRSSNSYRYYALYDIEGRKITKNVDETYYLWYVDKKLPIKDKILMSDGELNDESNKGLIGVIFTISFVISLILANSVKVGYEFDVAFAILEVGHFIMVLYGLFI